MAMHRLKIALIAVGVVVLVLAAAIAALVTIGGNRITAWAIEHPISSYIGRKVTVGKVEMHWGSPARLTIDDLRIANAPWSTSPQMFTARRVQVEFQPASLVHATKNFPLVAVDHATLLLETAKDGRRNWSFLDKLLASNPRGQFPILKNSPPRTA